MKSIPILKIEDVFQLSDGRCILTPDFPTSENLSLSISTEALVVENSEETKPCVLHLELTHLNIPTTNDPNKRWRITAILSEIDCAEIKVGDVLHIFDAKIAEALAISSK